jgi:hypothetical protein
MAIRLSRPASVRGNPSASATGTLPLNPPQKITCCHENGRPRPLQRDSAPMPYTISARLAIKTLKTTRMESRSSTNRLGRSSKPMRRKRMELTRKATASQNRATLFRVSREGTRGQPWLPITNPITATAITPETWSSSASRNAP